MSAVPAASRFSVQATWPFGWPRNQRSPSTRSVSRTRRYVPVRRPATRSSTTLPRPTPDTCHEFRIRGSRSLITLYIAGRARCQKREARGAGSDTRARYAAMASPGDLALATRGLRTSYGSRLALDGLDLSVPSGVVYGFLGPNGAGKTTTMRLLTGLLHPDAGSIELLGRPF